MPASSFKLDPEQWALIQALEFGTLDIGRLETDLARLETLELATRQGDSWHMTDYGRLLAASRRIL